MQLWYSKAKVGTTNQMTSVQMTDPTESLYLQLSLLYLGDFWQSLVYFLQTDLPLWLCSFLKHTNTLNVLHSSWETVDRLCGCALHKALDVLCFDKDSTVFHCLYSRRLWSCRKTFSSCLESVGLRQNVITRFYSPSLHLPPFSLRPSSSPLFHVCSSTFPFFSHSPLFFLYHWSFTISFDHLFQRLLSFTHGKCFLFASRATDTISHILPHVSVLPSWHKTDILI